MKNLKILLLFIAIISFSAATAQDPTRFQNEVDKYNKMEVENTSDIILFTGSSSIRIWENIDAISKKHNILNRGFGGSQMSDLYYYREELILQYNPKQIFIYEGDNDISDGKSVEIIMADTEKLIAAIRRSLPNVPIVLISPKPSIARKQLKESYEALNKTFEQWASGQNNISFADVWTPMIAKNGEVKDDLFLKDNLHMNDKGYKIWEKVLKPFLLD